MAKRITAEEFSAEVLSSDVPVLVDFYSDSCIPCKRLSPILSKLETEYGEKLKIVKVNVLYEDTLTEQYEVQAAPTILFFKNGEEVSRIRGAVDAETLTAAIENL